METTKTGLKDKSGFVIGIGDIFYRVGNEYTKIKPCPKCGNQGELKITYGGSTPYYAIHCTKCSHNTRGMGNILPEIFSTDTPNTPQKTKEESLKIWNES